MAQTAIEVDKLARDVAKLVVSKLGHRLDVGTILHSLGNLVEVADVAVEALLCGTLGFNPNVKCDHHDHHGEGHDCGSHEHTCGSHGCH